MKYLSCWAEFFFYCISYLLRYQNESIYVYAPSVWPHVHYTCLYMYIIFSPIRTT